MCKKIRLFFCFIVTLCGVMIAASERPMDGKVYPLSSEINFSKVAQVKYSPVVGSAFSLNQKHLERTQQRLDLLRHTPPRTVRECGGEEKKSDSEDNKSQHGLIFYECSDEDSSRQKERVRRDEKRLEECKQEAARFFGFAEIDGLQQVRHPALVDNRLALQKWKSDRINEAIEKKWSVYVLEAARR